MGKWSCFLGGELTLCWTARIYGSGRVREPCDMLVVEGTGILSSSKGEVLI